MASAYPDCSDRDFKSESAAEEGPLDFEDRTGEKSPSAVSSPLYYPDSEEDGCSWDLGGFVRTEGLYYCPESHSLLASPSASREAGGGASSNTDGQDSASNSVGFYFPRTCLCIGYIFCFCFSSFIKYSWSEGHFVFLSFKTTRTGRSFFFSVKPHYWRAISLFK